MATHNLKILPEYFEAVHLRDKNFEIRFNDRGFQKGDCVVLSEFDPTQEDNFAKGKINGFTGRRLRADIGYVTNFEQKENYVVFSLINVVQLS